MINAVMENILTRRTIRRFRSEQIREEELHTVLEAGMYAPSAGGRQGVLFVVSQNRETDFLYGPYDASAAAENMLLAAHSIGLGGCYIGSAWDSFRDAFGQETLIKWNIRTDYYAVIHVLLGYPKEEQAPKGKARKEGRIILVN